MCQFHVLLKLIIILKVAIGMPTNDEGKTLRKILVCGGIVPSSGEVIYCRSTERRIGHYRSSSAVRTCTLQMGQDEIILTGMHLYCCNKKQKWQITQCLGSKKQTEQDEKLQQVIRIKTIRRNNKICEIRM
jgi:hypothetical protein